MHTLDSISFLTVAALAVTCGMFLFLDWISGTRPKEEAEDKLWLNDDNWPN